MSSNRIQWIDATKGTLILLMVLCHITSKAGSQGMDTFYLLKCMSLSSIFTCFYMQAFLILTGYTSNFDKDLNTFVISLIKTILIPWFSFSILSQLIHLFDGEGGALLINVNNQNFFFLIEDYWFLHVIFFGKLIYYIIQKYINSDYMRGGILLGMMILGFSIFAMHGNQESNFHYNNYLHYKDTLCMSFFIWVGSLCRRMDMLEKIKRKTYFIFLSLYLAGHIVRYFFRMKGIDELLIAPVIISHGGNVVSPVQIPSYIYFVILGSLSCFGIMQYIKKCSLLEFYGRNSLVVYCMHFIFLGITVNAVNTIIPPVSIINALLFIICSLGLVLLSCTIIIYMTKYKPFNYLIGKF